MERDERLERKIDKITVDVADIGATLRAYHESLNEHKRQDEALAKRVDAVEHEAHVTSGMLKALFSVGIVGVIGKWLKG